MLLIDPFAATFVALASLGSASLLGACEVVGSNKVNNLKISALAFITVVAVYQSILNMPIQRQVKAQGKLEEHQLPSSGLPGSQVSWMFCFGRWIVDAICV